MKYIINKDKKKRLLYKKYELKRLYLKSIINSEKISRYIKINAIKKLNSLPKNSSIIRIKNRCVITGRGKSVYRFFRFSRAVLRNYANNGLLPGITKSSW